MKNYLFLQLLLISISGKSVTLELNQKDSVHYNFIGLDTILQGNSVTIEAKGKKFQIGVFGFYNDEQNPEKKRGVVAMYKMDGKGKFNFFKKFDLINYEPVANLKYLIIEDEIYSITELTADKLTMEKSSTADRSGIKAGNFLECIYDIDYFDGKLTDSLNNNVPSSVLFKKDKLNILYYTITYCKPCESAKEEMIKLSRNKKINLIFITEAGVKFDKGYITNQKYFYNRSRVRNGLGYPTLLLFDGKGDFIKTIKGLSLSVIDSIKNDAVLYE